MAVKNSEQYDRALDRWKTTRDATDGQEAVKRGAYRYLPDFIPSDQERYTQYLKFAYYVNITGRTKKGLLGAVYRKKPVIDLPATVDYLIQNANSAGQGLVQFSRAVTGEVVEVGRIGLLSDYPQADQNLTVAEVNRLDLKPYITTYEAESIKDWLEEVINGSTVLSYVLLEEQTRIRENGQTKDVVIYRELSLTDGVYSQRVYSDDDPIGFTFDPRQANGERWSEIPFVFIGSEDNTPSVDMSPLYDLANINLAQYRNIADREASLRVFSQISLHIDTGEMRADEWNNLNPDGITFGATSAIVTNGGGSVNLLQANPSDIASQAIKDKSDEMVSVGARLIDKQGQNQTAEAARINASSEMSVLEVIVDNVSNGITKAIKWCQVFAGDPESESSFQLNTEFFDNKMTAQELMAVIQLADRGDISDEDMSEILTSNNLKPVSGSAAE